MSMTIISQKEFSGRDVREVKKIHAPLGKGYTLDMIALQMDAVQQELQTAFPNVNWRKVRVEPNRYNFIAEKKDEPPAEIPVEQPLVTE